MAKSNNFFNIRGKIGDLVFYVRNGKTYVKPYSGDKTKASMQHNPRIKAAQQSFGEISSFVKSFKQALTPYLWRQKDGSFHNQLMSMFSQIRSSSLDTPFQEILQSELFYLRLKNKSLNKNARIKTCYFTYVPATQELQINGGLLYELSHKYAGFFLEVATGWYSTVEGQAYLSPPERQYFKIDTQLLDKPICLDFATAAPDGVGLPFVALSVVYAANPSSSSLHPVHSLVACFV